MNYKEENTSDFLTAKEPMAAYGMDLNALRAQSVSDIMQIEDLGLMKKIASAIRSLLPSKEETKDSTWANQFAGAWKDSRSVEEIIEDIRSSRTFNQEIDL